MGTTANPRVLGTLSAAIRYFNISQWVLLCNVRERIPQHKSLRFVSDVIFHIYLYPFLVILEVSEPYWPHGLWLCDL